MPANFGEIANYHSRLAAQHIALAQAARDRGDLNAAEYNRQLAARYIEAAEEQRMAMSHAPGQLVAAQPSRPWTQKASQPARSAAKTARVVAVKLAAKSASRRIPLAAACLSRLRRGAGSLANALRQSLSSAHASLERISLPDSPPAHATQLRG